MEVIKIDKPNVKLQYGKVYLIALFNTRTKEKEKIRFGFIQNGGSFKQDIADFYTNIRVYITHKNRLGWKINDCKYSIVEATEENENKLGAWLNNISIDEYLKIKQGNKMENEFI